MISSSSLTFTVTTNQIEILRIYLKVVKTGLSVIQEASFTVFVSVIFSPHLPCGQTRPSPMILTSSGSTFSPISAHTYHHFFFELRLASICFLCPFETPD